MTGKPILREFVLRRTANGIRIQYAALPMRVGASGAVEILLITSRETGRWVIPKGWPKKGMSGPETAREEAYEEAGIKGRVLDQPIGKYRYMKWTPRRVILCEVTVFPMHVEAELDSWPECMERNVMWSGRAQAANLVEEPGLAEIMEKARF